ncbi:type II toxin-antitoxin system RelE/ParE family toxin [soil metagenome]
MKLVWSPEAAADLRDAVTFIAGDDPRAADEVEDRILAAVERLRAYPESGRGGRRTGTRELVVRRTPYLIVYRVRAASIDIVRVWHTSRRPFR